jgi:hypothetical protein
MSESDGKTAEFVKGFVAGLRWAKQELAPVEVVEDWHGLAKPSE